MQTHSPSAKTRRLYPNANAARTLGAFLFPAPPGPLRAQRAINLGECRSRPRGAAAPPTQKLGRGYVFRAAGKIKTLRGRLKRGVIY